MLHSTYYIIDYEVVFTISSYRFVHVYNCIFSIDYCLVCERIEAADHLIEHSDEVIDDIKAAVAAVIIFIIKFILPK